MQARETRAVGHGHPLGTNTGLQGLGKAMTRTRGAQTPPAFTPALLEASVVVFPRGAAHEAEQHLPHPWAQRDGAAGGVRDAATAGRVWLRWEGFGNLPLEKAPASSAPSWFRSCAAMPQCPLVLQGAVAKSLSPSPPSVSAGGSPNISAPHHTVRAASPSICQNPGLLQLSRLQDKSNLCSSSPLTPPNLNPADPSRTHRHPNFSCAGRSSLQVCHPPKKNGGV